MRTSEERAAYEAAHPPVFIPPSLYKVAERQGLDMTGYKITKPIPLIGDDIGASSNASR